MLHADHGAREVDSLISVVVARAVASECTLIDLCKRRAAEVEHLNILFGVRSFASVSRECITAQRRYNAADVECVARHGSAVIKSVISDRADDFDADGRDGLIVLESITAYIATLADINFGKRRTAGEAIASDTGQFPFHFTDLGALEGMAADRAGAVNFEDERRIFAGSYAFEGPLSDVRD